MELFWFQKRDRGGDEHRRFFSRERKFLQLVGLIVAVLLTLIIIPKGGFVPAYYAPGDIASRDVKAPRDLNVPDLELTEKKRQAAEDAIRPLYDYSTTAAEEVSAKVLAALNTLWQRDQLETLDASLYQSLETQLGVKVSEKDVKILATIPNDEQLLPQVQEAMQSAFRLSIVANMEVFRGDLKEGIVIRRLPGGGEQLVKELPKVVGLEEAQKFLRGELKKIRELDRPSSETLFGILVQILRPNLTFNKNELETRRKLAREAVSPIFYQVKKGEMIVREGEKVSEDAVKILRVLSDIGNDSRVLNFAAGLFLFIILIMDVSHRFGRRNLRQYRLTRRDAVFVASTLAMLFFLFKIMIFVSGALESAFPYIPSASYYYAFPFAIGAMLVRTVMNAEMSLFFSLFASLLFGILFGNNMLIMVYALCSSLIGSHSVARCKVRSTIYLAGLKISLVNVIAVIIIALLGGVPLDAGILYRIGFAFIGGFGCAVIANGTIPLVESLFKYTTDLKLLELANMNSPILRELMIQAPGTYHHSVVVGNMVEAAAEAINANPLLARVAAYYHDIGKVKKPLYFIENIRDGENRHDRLAPSMSALILTSHVKDGIELAREHRLGEAITDIIRQHHGTSLIKFFYDKAKNQADPDDPPVDERDYRYPGPRPQTREAALIMLADATEAASRTLTDPTPARIQGMVQKIINNIFIDGQLDECDLTLRDLHAIARSFNQVLAGTFHQRVDYPEPAAKGKEKEKEKDQSKKEVPKNGSSNPPREPADEAAGEGRKTHKGSTEDLKRLGMS